MADIENNENINEAEVNDVKVEHRRNWLTALILCWFLGFLGVHRMYAGKIGSGFLMLYGTIVAACILYMNFVLGLVAFTVVGSFVVNDFLRISTKTFKDCRGEYIVEDKI